MKRTQFRIALLTVCFMGAGSVSHAQSCGAEACNAKPCKCCHKQCDDRGLLEVVNNVATSFESTLASVIPEPGTKRRTSHTCNCKQCATGESASMQLQIVPPTVQEESIGPPMTQITAPQPQMRHGSVHQEPLKSTPDRVNPSGVPVPSKLIPARPIPVPESEFVPPPDSRIDPFKDETTHNLRAVPAGRAHQLTPSKVGTDPQAGSLNSSLKNVKLATATKSISDKELATTTSTRRPQTNALSAHKELPQAEQAGAVENSSTRVVVASLALPVSPLRSKHQTSNQAAPEDVVNPLRAR